jgi:hypothetical protein
VGCDPRKNDIPPASTAIMNSFGALNRVRLTCIHCICARHL